MPGLGLKQAPQPYGAFALETMDAYGGWIGAPIDYLRFVLAIDGRRGAALLNAATLAQMTARDVRESADGDESTGHGVYYGLGIRIRPVKNGANLFHTGSIPGTSTLAVRTADGFAWVVMFNGRPQDKNGFRGDVDRGLWSAKSKVTRWPAGDLFPGKP